MTPDMTASDALPRESTVSADLVAAMAEIGRRARHAAAELALAPAAAKSAALHATARVVRERRADILAANARDLGEAEGLAPALRDRLALDNKRVEAVA